MSTIKSTWLKISVISLLVVLLGIAYLLVITWPGNDIYTRRADDGTTVKYYADKPNGMCFALINDTAVLRVACDEVMPAQVVK